MRRVRSVMLRINIVEQKKREKEKYTLQWARVKFLYENLIEKEESTGSLC